MYLEDVYNERIFNFLTLYYFLRSNTFLKQRSKNLTIHWYYSPNEDLMDVLDSSSSGFEETNDFKLK